mmetsp:Transcript_5934/g.15079  ORF Transcript_5934/g.15079 Transcript_5934/m.15079 type:complete len:198 (+) Transcript_5934:250-843(+)
MRTVKSSIQLSMGDDNAAAASTKTAAAAAAPKPVTLDLHTFIAAHPGYTYGPLIVCAILAASWHVPPVAEFYASRDLTPWGAANAASYTLFAIVTMFAVHGAICCYRWEEAPRVARRPAQKPRVPNAAPPKSHDRVFKTLVSRARAYERLWEPIFIKWRFELMIFKWRCENTEQQLNYYECTSANLRVPALCDKVRP